MASVERDRIDVVPHMEMSELNLADAQVNGGKPGLRRKGAAVEHWRGGRIDGFEGNPMSGDGSRPLNPLIEVKARSDLDEDVIAEGCRKRIHDPLDARKTLDSAARGQAIVRIVAVRRHV